MIKTPTKHLIMGILLHFAFVGIAQTPDICRVLVCSAGASTSVSDKTFDQSIGEPFIATIGAGMVSLSQGMQQKETCPLAVSTSEPNNGFFVEAFPNPAISQIQFLFHAEKVEQYSLHIFDAQGRIVQVLESTPLSERITIDVSHYSSGVYFALFLTSTGHSTSISFTKG